MTDELTPEEKQAIENLPRERMPAGLEERVVGAMREHGFLARRRRTIEISNGRVAGLLAACVALIIGAYSIGLHRGDSSQPLRVTETKKTEDGGRIEKPLAAPPKDDVEPQVASDAWRSNALEAKPESPAPLVPAPAASWEETRAGRIVPDEAREEEIAAGASEIDESPSAKAASPSVSKESAARLQAPPEGLVSGASIRPLTFYLNGSPVIVEAPDSVRVIQDERGRMLLIYTSDGIIRIRLGDD